MMVNDVVRRLPQWQLGFVQLFSAGKGPYVQ